jgi:hypothetical protein
MYSGWPVCRGTTTIPPQALGEHDHVTDTVILHEGLKK